MVVDLYKSIRHRMIFEVVSDVVNQLDLALPDGSRNHHRNNVHSALGWRRQHMEAGLLPHVSFRDYMMINPHDCRMALERLKESRKYGVCI